MFILGVMVAAWFFVLFFPFWWVVNKSLAGAETPAEVKSRAVPLGIATVMLMITMALGASVAEWLTSKVSFMALF